TMDTPGASISFDTGSDDGSGAPPGPSCVAYRIHACPDITGFTVDPQLSAVGTYPVTVRVTDRAGNTTTTDPVPVNVTEAAEPVGRGRTFRVRGQVQGADPRKGVRLRVQVKRGKRWRTAGIGRAGKAGRYAIAARITRGGTAKLRVAVRGRSDWPYEPGVTRT